MFHTNYFRVTDEVSGLVTTIIVGSKGGRGDRSTILVQFLFLISKK